MVKTKADKARTKKALQRQAQTIRELMAAGYSREYSAWKAIQWHPTPRQERNDKR